MKAYADTNFFTNLYLHLSHGAEAKALWDRYLEESDAMIPVTELLQMEFSNAVERCVYESSRGGQWRVTANGAMLAACSFEGTIEAGGVLEERSIGLSTLKTSFGLMVQRHTAKYGFRTYDIVHVASALVLGCDTFWSFDKKALQLAKLEGLKTN